MQARLLELTIGLNGKQRLSIELDEDFRHKFDTLKDADVELTVEKFYEKRGVKANAYCWVLVDRIAKKLRLSKDEVYRNAIRDIGGVSDVMSMPTKAVAEWTEMWTSFGRGWQVEELESQTPGWSILVCYKGSSVYNTEQFSSLIDHLEQDARALGIETRPPEEINSMMEEYEKWTRRKHTTTKEP